jgi:endonuclease YncB( thermonuclease family)
VPLVHVIDGDSLTVSQKGDTVTVRLTSIDAVEYRKDCGRADSSRWSCGHDARRALEQITGTGRLHGELAAQDAYQRALASSRTRPFPDGVDLGAEMVRRGWAVATSNAYFGEEAGHREAPRHLAGQLRAAGRLARERPLCLAAICG